MVFKNFIIFSIFLALITGLFALAGTLTITSSPTTTMYTLTDIYNLIHNNQISTEGDHSFSPGVNPNTLSSYSVSQIYADLTNLIKRENVATGTTYLNIVGDYGNPDPDYSTTTVIASTFTPQGSSGTSWGYSLEDIWNLIETGATTTPGQHDSAPTTTPQASMHTLTQIYDALVQLGTDKAGFVATGNTYLGAEGSYVPSVTVIFDQQGATFSSSPTSINLPAIPVPTVGILPFNPIRDAYVFGGWFTEIDGGGTEFLSNTPITNNITVYAKWIADPPCDDPTNSDCWSNEISNKTWGPVGVTSVSNPINGRANTITLVALSSEYEAATYCDSLSEGGHTGWYLPAKDQLFAGWQAFGAGEFSSNGYWSSTESSQWPDISAWALGTGGGSMMDGSTKPSGYSLRCLR
jgi:uncharacterized repeat protein (TIGR02543 family)